MNQYLEKFTCGNPHCVFYNFYSGDKICARCISDQWDAYVPFNWQYY